MPFLSGLAYFLRWWLQGQYQMQIDSSGRINRWRRQGGFHWAEIGEEYGDGWVAGQGVLAPWALQCSNLRFAFGTNRRLGRYQSLLCTDASQLNVTGRLWPLSTVSENTSGRE